MKIDHVAIWTDKLEEMRDYYVKYFEGICGDKYRNLTTGFESFFISFQDGSRIELMSQDGVPDSLDDNLVIQHKGIIHIAFGANSISEVDLKARKLTVGGYRILRGPRTTGDGYYEFETLDPGGNRIEVTTVFR